MRRPSTSATEPAMRNIQSNVVNARMNDSPLFSGELSYHRSKILHLRCLDLEIGNTIAVSLLNQVGYHLRGAQGSPGNGPPTLLRRGRCRAIGNVQIVNSSTQLQLRKAVAGSFFYPAELLLQGSAALLRSPGGPDADDI